jgi:hypothetical protein
MTSTLARFEFSGFFPVGTPKERPWCMQLLLTTKMHFTVELWMPVRLCLNACCGPWWYVLRHVLDLMEKILNTYCKCTLSAITQKLNVSGHLLVWAFILWLVYGTRAQNLTAICRYILHVRFEVFAPVTMKNAIFWDVALCRSKCRFTQDLHSATSQKTAFFTLCMCCVLDKVSLCLPNTKINQDSLRYFSPWRFL